MTEFEKKLDILTNREREVILLLLSQKNYVEIAKELGVSVVCIKNHSMNAIKRLKYRDRCMAMADLGYLKGKSEFVSDGAKLASLQHQVNILNAEVHRLKTGEVLLPLGGGF